VNAAAAVARRSAAPLAAFVLHRYDWSETSLIVELFTREQGRVVAAAKGAKRPTSQLRPVLLPFQRLAVTLGRPPERADGGELQTLKSAEWAGGVPALAGAALFRGFYANELLLKLLARHDAHARLFDAYAALLPAWGAADDAQAQAALRAFELVLLRDIGLLPDLALATLTLQAVQPDAAYLLRAESGVVPASASADSPLLGRTLLALAAALGGAHGGGAAPPALLDACASQPAALRLQLRGLLHYHLGSPQLRTRQVLQQVQQLKPPAATARPR
jgi:DNA repair protein RecO (recombination protein O)